MAERLTAGIKEIQTQPFQKKYMSQTFYHIPSLLTPEELEKIDQWIGLADFEDGKSTASMSAREVKQNKQAIAAGNESVSSIQAILQHALQTSPLFQVAAQPRQIHPFLISKYGKGDYYGWHVDSPQMGTPPIRTDLAMTIFLSDPAAYEGGELFIQTGNGTVTLKPAKGDAVLYPCQFLHCVNAITAGERKAAVTWIQSNIRSAEQRELLYQFNQVHALLHQRDPQAAETNVMLQAYSNLYRMWAEI